MTQSKQALVSLGSCIVQCDERNSDNHYTVDDVRGISINKTIIDTKANMDGVPLTSYKLFKPNQFCYVPVTSRNGNKITLAINNTDKIFIVSATYEVFRVADEKVLDPSFLYLWFCRPEFDRYARFNSWGSARESFSYAEMERVMIPLPDIDLQREIVAAWKHLRTVKEENEALAAPLFQLCQSKIQGLKHTLEPVEIGQYIEQSDDRNSDGKYTADDVRGLATSKEIIETKANMEGVPVTSYKIVRPGDFAYVSDTSRRGDKVSMGYNSSNETFIVSSISTVFRSKDTHSLLPEFLFLWLKRPEFDRYARFHSWGSARETFVYEDMEKVKIPLPDIKVQEAIVDIFNSAQKAKQIAEEADRLSREICPALMQKAINS